MRIRKRQVPLPLSSLSPAPVSLSDPHIINRSWGSVQLHQNSILQTATPPSVTTTATTVSAPTSALASPKPTSYSCPQQNLSSLLVEEDSIVGGTTISQLNRQPSDHQKTKQTFGKATNGPDSSCPRWPHKQEGNQNSCLELLSMEDEKKQEKDKSHYSRERTIVGSERAGKALPLLNPPQGVRAIDGRRCDGETSFPLKKRRGSLGSKVKEETAMESNKKSTSRMTTKMNNKFSVQNDFIAPEVEEQGEEKETTAKLGVNNANRKRVRGTTLLEGSRCSRVNGRGWRCCQQTLVGYSLCEHHLGKGRLRSMTSVRSRSSLGSRSSSTVSTRVTAAPKRKKSTSDQTSTSSMSLEPSSSSPEKNQPPSSTTSCDCDEIEVEDHHEEEMKPLQKRKKTMKLGMVKARSISSLLVKTNHENTGSSTAILQ